MWWSHVSPSLIHARSRAANRSCCESTSHTLCRRQHATALLPFWFLGSFFPWSAMLPELEGAGINLPFGLEYSTITYSYHFDQLWVFTSIYHYKHKYLEDNFITCLLSRTAVVGSLPPKVYDFSSSGVLTSCTVPSMNLLLWCRPWIQWESGWLPSELSGHCCIRKTVLPDKLVL